MDPAQVAHRANEPQTALKVVGVPESYQTMAVVAKENEQGDQTYHLIDGQSVNPENIIPLRAQSPIDDITRNKKMLRRLVDPVKSPFGKVVRIHSRLKLTERLVYPLRWVATPPIRPTPRELDFAGDCMLRLKPRFRRILTARDVFHVAMTYCTERGRGECTTPWTMDDHIVFYKTWRRFGKLHDSNNRPSLSAFVGAYVNDRLLKNGDAGALGRKPQAFEVEWSLIDHPHLLKESDSTQGI